MLQSKNQGIGTARNKAGRHQALPDHRARAEKQYLLLSQRYESRPLRKREADNKIKSKTARNRRILFPHVCRADAYDYGKSRELWKNAGQILQKFGFLPIQGKLRQLLAVVSDSHADNPGFAEAQKTACRSQAIVSLK